MKNALIFLGLVLISFTLFSYTLPTNDSNSKLAPTNSTYIIQSVHYGHILDNSIGTSKRIQLFLNKQGCSDFAGDGKNQQWYLEEKGKYYVIRNAYRNQVLSLGKASPDNKSGTRIVPVLAPFRNTADQYWYIKAIGDTWKIYNKQSNQLIDVSTSRYYNGDNANCGQRFRKPFVQLWKDLGNSSEYSKNAGNQRWRIIPVDDFPYGECCKKKKKSTTNRGNSASRECTKYYKREEYHGCNYSIAGVTGREHLKELLRNESIHFCGGSNEVDWAKTNSSIEIHKPESHIESCGIKARIYCKCY